MTSIKIRLTMMTDDVKRFAAIVGEYPYDIDLCSGRYVVDAKSLLGILSMGLGHGEEMKIIADGKDEDEAVFALGELVANGASEA